MWCRNHRAPSLLTVLQHGHLWRCCSFYQRFNWEKPRKEMSVLAQIRYRICPALAMAQDGANCLTGNYCSGVFTPVRSASATINFPIPFPTTQGRVILILSGTATNTDMSYIIQDDNLLSRTSFSFRRTGSQVRFNWFCIGE